MSKNKPNMPTQSEPYSGRPPARGPTARRPTPNLAVRMVVSVLVTWHVFAVFMAPLSLPPTSRLVANLVQGTPEQSSPMQWYLDALYINHGYHFFAPDPGPGHLIRYVVTDDRGASIAEGTFPDRKEYWPRLRYHRYFMLSDQAMEGVGTLQDLSERPIAELSPREMFELEQLYARRSQERRLDAYARHLLQEYGGAQAQVTRVRHDMLSPFERRENVPMDDPIKYETVMQRVQRASDLERQPATAAARSPEFGAWHNTVPQRRFR